MELYEKAVALWKSKRIDSDAALAEALNGHSIAFAYHSGKIENENVTYHDTREIFEHDGVTAYTGDLRTLFEIRKRIVPCCVSGKASPRRGAAAGFSPGADEKHL